MPKISSLPFNPFLRCGFVLNLARFLWRFVGAESPLSSALLDSLSAVTLPGRLPAQAHSKSARKLVWVWESELTLRVARKGALLRFCRLGALVAAVVAVVALDVRDALTRFASELYALCHRCRCLPAAVLGGSGGGRKRSEEQARALTFSLRSLPRPPRPSGNRESAEREGSHT